MGHRLEPFQKLVVATWASVVVLIFVGAVVRATGAGLGCPDWPTCWGRLIPPVSVDQVDFERINLERFRKKAERFGIDPESITEATLREQFNPVHVWTEYINRLTSLPLGFLALATAIAGFRQARRGRRLVFLGGLAALVIVLVNAWLGRMVVLSGLKPGIITLHMALAILLLGILIYIAWRGCARPWQLPIMKGRRRRLLAIVVGLLVVTIFEGLIGSQVREMTDELAKVHAEMPRASWTLELENTWMYLVHRTFSWMVLAAALVFYWNASRALPQGCGWLEKSILALVLSQMVLGLVLAHIGILPGAQILHIGLSSLLVSALFLWMLASSSAGEKPRETAQAPQKHGCISNV